MPTNTFFRLPEEKRQRLLDAARENFCKTPFSEVSINRIIGGARIPRGSFYQYFADKEDLFRYLMGEMREYFCNTLSQILDEAGGDLFAVPLRAFDRLMGRGGATDPMLARCVEIMRLNHGMDLRWLIAEENTPLMKESIYQQLDLDGFRRRERRFVDNVFFMLLAPLTRAIAETLQAPDQRELQRGILEERIELVQVGSLKIADVSAAAKS